MNDKMFTEGFIGDMIQKNKDKKKLEQAMYACAGRIYKELYNLLPINATVIRSFCTRKDKKWKIELLIYMTRTPDREKPITESQFESKFNISKAMVANVKEVIELRLNHFSQEIQTPIYGFDMTIYCDGYCWYQLSTKPTETKAMVQKTNAKMKAKFLSDKERAMPGNFAQIEGSVDDGNEFGFGEEISKLI